MMERSERKGKMVCSRAVETPPQYHTEDGGDSNLPVYIPRLRFRPPREADGEAIYRVNLLVPEPVFKDPQIQGLVENWPLEIRAALGTSKFEGKDLPSNIESQVPYNPQHQQRPPRESNYYGAWNSMLQNLFPVKDSFVVKPQAYSSDDHRGTADFMVCYQICFRNVPLSTFELKPPQNLSFASHRADADAQIRNRMYDISTQHYGNMLRNIPAPKTVYGLSVFGHQMSFYTMNAELHSICFPLPIPQELVDLPPQSWWKNDVSTASGRYLLRLFAQHIHEQVASFGDILHDESQFIHLVDPYADALESHYGVVPLEHLTLWKTEPEPVSRESTAENLAKDPLFVPPPSLKYVQVSPREAHPRGMRTLAQGTSGQSG
ncbi:hypothetical protein C8R44DRAFT_896166 [Mycena epipterygia]|nr:hypothetical protein C8R44DRAFT_896166 [Mycena epipterygia]